MRSILKIFLGLLLLLLAALGGFIFYAIQPGLPENQFASSAVIEFKEYAARSLANAPSQLKVATYNIGYGSSDKNNLGDILTRDEVEKNLAQMAAELKKHNFDIIALQEVDFYAKRSFDIDQFRFLAKALEMPYGAYIVTWNKKYIAWPYWPISQHFGRVVSGQAVLSRFPIVSQTTRVLPKPENNPFWYNWFYLERILQKNQIKVGEVQWSLFNVHLEAFDAQRRLDQLLILAQEVNHAPAKTRWVLGDFNLASFTAAGATPEEADTTGALKKFAQSTDLQMAETGQFFLSMPAVDPVKKIDHIFFPQPFRLQTAGNIPDLLASDHLAVWAEFSTF